MEIGGIKGGVYKVCEWIMRFAYINLLWLLFSLVGLIIFGVFPATIAMFTVVRAWAMKKTDTPIFITFWNSYRTEFLKSNVIGLLLAFAGLVLYIDYMYILTLNGWLYIIMIFLLINLSIIYMVVLLYIIPVYVHYDLKGFQYLKYTVIIGISHPLITLSIVILAIPILFILLSIPGLLPFYSGSVLSFMVMWITYQQFKKLEEKFSG